MYVLQHVASRLLEQPVYEPDAVTILHSELVWRLVLTDSLAVEEEADRLHGHVLPLAKHAHSASEASCRALA